MGLCLPPKRQQQRGGPDLCWQTVPRPRRCHWKGADVPADDNPKEVVTACLGQINQDRTGRAAGQFHRRLLSVLEASVLAEIPWLWERPLLASDSRCTVRVSNVEMQNLIAQYDTYVRLKNVVYWRVFRRNLQLSTPIFFVLLLLLLSWDFILMKCIWEHVEHRFDYTPGLYSTVLAYLFGFVR